MNEEIPAASVTELKDGLLYRERVKHTLTETLQARGVLGQIKARIRSEIFQAIEDHETPRPKLSNENLVINELIREYLEYNGYRHSLSVFIPETGQPIEKPFDRSFLSRELNVAESSKVRDIPLLYGIISKLQENKLRSNIDETPKGSLEQQIHINKGSSNFSNLSPQQRNTSPKRSKSFGGVNQNSSMAVIIEN